MALQMLADLELQTLADVVAATAQLLDRLRSASTQPERDALAADFHEAIQVLRADLARHDQDADAMIAGALARVAHLLVPDPAGA